jgi:hypothetical protein
LDRATITSKARRPALDCPIAAMVVSVPSMPEKDNTMVLVGKL